MVLFANVNLNQRVEILRAGVIFMGTVKYKGHVNSEPGEWVGIALDTPDGLHDGLYRGRRYFSCRDKHGIFTTASQIRFIPLKRCLFNSYRRVEQNSGTEEDLFNNESGLSLSDYESEHHEVMVEPDYKNRLFSNHRDGSELFQRPYFPLNHSVSRMIPSAVMLNPDLEKSKCFGQTPRRSSGRGYVSSTPDFITSPTIPKVHMPHSALKHQAVRGWTDAHYTREVTVNTARDSIKYNHWNDI